MLKRLGFALIFVFVLTGASCDFKKNKSKTDVIMSPQTTGMIYGHVSADQPVTAVLLRRHDDIEGRLKIGSKTYVYPDGQFAIVNVPPGQYVLAGYRANRLVYPAYGSDEEPSGDVVRVRARQLTYAGSYRIVAGEKEESGPMRYRVQKKSQPGEKSILLFLKSQSGFSDWSKLMEKRIDELH